MALHDKNELEDEQVSEKDKEPTTDDKGADDKGASGQPSEGTQKTETVLTIPKTRFDEVNAAKKAAEAELDKLRTDAKKVEDESLAEQGKYKALWEKAAAETEVANLALASLKSDEMRRGVATEAGFPALWDRISGDNEEALKADMATLVGNIPQAKAPDISGGTGSKKRSGEKGKQKMTKEERTALATALGVMEQYLPEN